MPGAPNQQVGYFKNWVAPNEPILSNFQMLAILIDSNGASIMRSKKKLRPNFVRLVS